MWSVYLWAAHRSSDRRGSDAGAGRDPAGIRGVFQFTLIVAATDDEAQETLEQYWQYAIGDDDLALFAGISGIDVSQLGLDEELPTFFDDMRRHGFAPAQREAGG
jgi:alkanesulfonate monooxygenase SsuD/methylene tetrahydromethanopterin reductase-like flavin-dependent oxidoreductase (luciferase family)